MSPRLPKDQLLNAMPTMWDNHAQVTSLAGRVESGYSFAIAHVCFGCQASKRIARRLGTPEDSS
jgi:hypothetical protein